ncbi:hypothetical protein HS1genome_0556 [Sulfodiicoccus acidiphilus]|uniref:FAD dependent oxidoreductase domain-containing protein n=1 Tax=Sulfodiicoccus acidiphilus TaxID=1670455 RepID=A0A348B1W5_9CREN|nr:FAD-dependent oxidoreductase [Sulfodiicoccus acidiphilus]BBD72167.1 hypothetical protein HS1genome_0556 [Sulfodiicoccus acidiphilus]GGT94524.1 hypothetical protein GCM10007116_10150 [Sulfodiicoccus acidiphilus]
MTRVVVIGGGATGLFVALDLSLRGVEVVVVERGDIGSGTSGKFHGMLHSGARYAVNDPQAARECVQESEVMSKIAPHAVEDTGGLFVALNEEEANFGDKLSSALKSVGAEHREVEREEALKQEPALSHALRRAIWVHDRVVHGYDLLSSVALTAFENGAKVLTFTEVVDFLKGGGVKVRDVPSGRTYEIRSDHVVNAAGPWTFRLAELEGETGVEVMPTAGTMAVFSGRPVNSVLNRMRPPSDGDILLPYGGNVIAGTTAKVVDDPNQVEADDEEVELLRRESSAMVPWLEGRKPVRTYASVRPLVKQPGASGRSATRDFVIHEHHSGLVTSVIGGKLTTSRLVGEKTADRVGETLGVRERSRTAFTELLSPRSEKGVRLIEKGLGFVHVNSREGGVDQERYEVVACWATSIALRRMSLEG